MSDHAEATTSGHQYAHHFESAEHEFQSSKFGMWLFLVTEVMMFGGLFVAYTIFRSMYPEMYHEAHHHLDKVMGAINTIVLICSSLSMAMGVGFAQRNKPRQSAWCLAITILCAIGFLVVKYFEYSHKFHDGLLPGAHFHAEGFTHKNADLFFSLYFMMTGLHGIHVLIGICLISWLLKRTLRGDFNSKYYGPVEFVGLFWHLVDLIWIYLFPLLYLIG